jgi:radical SAM protein with 4Fe4S-binding SPASM domain
MSHELAIKSLDYFFESFPNGEKYFVDLSGKGEPLLNKKVIRDVALYCHKKSDELMREVLPMLVCNGTLLSKENVAFLQELGVLFGVSLDGPKSINDLYRKDKSGSGTFDSIINNVLSIEHREYVGCATTLTNDVFPLVETIEYLSTIFNTLSFRLCRSPIYGLSKISLEKWKQEYLYLTEKLRIDIDNSNVEIFKCLMNGDDLFGRYLFKMFGNSRTINRCDGLITRFTCDLDGKIYGCPASSGIKSFEVSKSKISEYAKSELRRQANQCFNCPFKFYCGGECKLETNFYGHINEYNCEFKQHLIKLAAYLKVYCLKNNLKMFEQLNDFCLEKKARNRIDPELKDFCDAHPNMTFTEAKKEFDKQNKRY